MPSHTYAICSPCFLGAFRQSCAEARQPHIKGRGSFDSSRSRPRFGRCHSVSYLLCEEASPLRVDQSSVGPSAGYFGLSPRRKGGMTLRRPSGRLFESCLGAVDQTSGQWSLLQRTCPRVFSKSECRLQKLPATAKNKKEATVAKLG